MRVKPGKTDLAQALSFGLGVLLLITVAGLGWTQTHNRSADSKSRQEATGSVERGKYIVEGVAMCGQCHTPRTSDGAPDRMNWLQGAPLWLKPAMPIGDWPLDAPRIAGIIPGTDEDMIRLLTTGVWRDGKRLRPPMPQFRMSRQDAEAVVAYLKSASPVENREQTSPSPR